MGQGFVKSSCGLVGKGYCSAGCLVFLSLGEARQGKAGRAALTSSSLHARTPHVAMVYIYICIIVLLAPLMSFMLISPMETSAISLQHVHVQCCPVTVLYTFSMFCLQAGRAQARPRAHQPRPPMRHQPRQAMVWSFSAVLVVLVLTTCVCMYGLYLMQYLRLSREGVSR